MTLFLAVRAIATLALTALAFAQDQTGGIHGTILDAVTHQPIRKATVNVADLVPGPQRNSFAITDASGAFAFDSLKAGSYVLNAQHPNYPNVRRRPNIIEVKSGEINDNVTIELPPAAAITGRVFDDDGDPLPGCNVQAQSADRFNHMFQPDSGSDENGEYRLSHLAAGKYKVLVRCGAPPFEPRPFSSGPDPPPHLAYLNQYFAMAADEKSAQVIEVAAGSEKSGVDFRMRTGAITQIHGTFSPTGADWRSEPVQVLLVSVDASMSAPIPGARMNREKGTFDFDRVFPGSYYLTAFSIMGSPENRIAAFEHVEVKDRPVEMTVEMKRAFDLTGSIEVENPDNKKINLQQFNVQLVGERAFGMNTLGAATEDGTFVLRSVTPNHYRVTLNGPNAFLKSVWLGSAQAPDGMIDLSSGTPEPLRIVASTNTATITGTAPTGEAVFAFNGDQENQFLRGARRDPSGHFTITDLPPGTYRVYAGDPNEPPDRDSPDAQEVTVHEGETATVDIKPRQ